MKVEFHSKIKHWLLDSYLEICMDVQKKRKKPFYYIDLFSGDGKCECDNPKDKWDGSPLIAASKCKKSQYPIFCIFNDENSDAISLLQRNLQGYKDCNIKIFNNDANKVYPEIVKLVPAKEHSLFFLDPFKHTQLNWSTVEGISKHTFKDFYGVNFVRRPELLVNLMTYTMQVDYQQHPEYIDRFFGNNNWKSFVKTCEDNKEPVHRGFLTAYVKQLEQIYNQRPFFIEIKQVGRSLIKGEGNVIYYLVFVTSHPRASEIFGSLQKYIQNYKKITWAKEYFTLKGYSSLEDFC